MFLIKYLVFPGSIVSVSSMGVTPVRSLVIANHASSGSLRTEMLGAALLTQFKGLEVVGSQPQIQAIDGAGTTYWWTGATWVPNVPTRNTVDNIRAGLPYWPHREIGFILYFSRSADEPNPEVYGLRLGYEVPGHPASILDYILDYALQSRLRKPVLLKRWLSSQDAPIPDVNPAGIQRTIVHQYDAAQFLAEVVYSCTVDKVWEYYPIEEVPLVLVRSLNSGPTRHITQSENIQISPNTGLVIQNSVVMDQLLEISVTAANPGDAETIARQLVQDIDDDGGLWLPGYGVRFPIVFTGGIDSDASLSKTEIQQLASVTFRVKLLNLPVAQSVSSVDLVTGINQTIFLET